MASSPLRSRTKYHARSVSFPSSSHPLIPQFNEHLRRLEAPQAPNSSSLPSISNSLNGLEDLYDCVDDLLLLPQTQQAFRQEYNKKWVDEALDGYLRLLDVCSTTKDVLSQAKQDVQELLSILRRRRDPNDFGRFLISRKKVKNVIQKSLKDLKRIETKSKVLPLEAVSMLKDVEAVTLAVFESFLLYVAGTKSHTRRSSWSVVSKLMHHKSVGCRDEVTDHTNEFETVEAALHSLISNKKMQVENVQNQLVKMESSIQDLEEGLERLFRHLIKTRVSLLNILNH